MEKYFDQIQDYIENLLSPAEREAFEQALQQDAGLREETALQQQLHPIICQRVQAAPGEAQLRQTLANNRDLFHTASTEAKTEPRVFQLKRWAIGVAVAACLLIVFNFFGLFAPNLTQLPTLSTETVRGTEQVSTLNQGIEAFNQAQYTTSAGIFSALWTQDTTQVRMQYYLGLSYLGGQDYTQAIQTLQPLAEGTSIYVDDAAYFTAVAAWKNNNTAKGLRFARQVSEASDYYDRAQKLIKKME